MKVLLHSDVTGTRLVDAVSTHAIDRSIERKSNELLQVFSMRYEVISVPQKSKQPPNSEACNWSLNTHRQGTVKDCTDILSFNIRSHLSTAPHVTHSDQRLIYEKRGSILVKSQGPAYFCAKGVRPSMPSPQTVRHYVHNRVVRVLRVI